jgi:hypothetical protein
MREKLILARVFLVDMVPDIWNDLNLSNNQP